MPWKRGGAGCACTRNCSAFLCCPLTSTPHGDAYPALKGNGVDVAVLAFQLRKDMLLHVVKRVVASTRSPNRGATTHGR